MAVPFRSRNRLHTCCCVVLSLLRRVGAPVWGRVGPADVAQFLAELCLRCAGSGAAAGPDHHGVPADV